MNRRNPLLDLEEDFDPSIPIDNEEHLIAREAYDENIRNQFNQDMGPDAFANQFKRLEAEGIVEPLDPVYDSVRRKIEQRDAINKAKGLLDRFRSASSPQQPQAFSSLAASEAQIEYDDTGFPNVVVDSAEEQVEPTTPEPEVTGFAPLPEPEEEPPAQEPVRMGGEPLAEPEPIEPEETEPLKEIPTREEVEEKVKNVELTDADKELTDLTLEDALKSKRDAQRRAMLMRAASAFSAAIIGGDRAVLSNKLGEDFAKMIEEYGKTPLEEYLIRNKEKDARQMREDKAFERAIKRTQFERQQERMIREQDPNSPESDLARTLASRLLPNRSFEGRTAAELNDMLPMMKDIYMTEASALAKQQSAEMAQLRLELQRHSLDLREQQMGDVNRRHAETLDMRREAAEIRDAQSQSERRGKIVDAFNKDPNVRKLKEREENMNTMQQLVKAAAKNPAAWNTIGAKAARAIAGEVGNLTEADKADYGGSKAWLSRLQRWVEVGAKGTPPKADLKDLKALVQMSEDSILDTYRNTAGQYSAQYASAYGVDAGDLYKMIMPTREQIRQVVEAPTEEEAPAETGTIRVTDGNEILHIPIERLSEAEADGFTRMD